MNSSMVVTEPLPAAVAERIGWHRREVFGDLAHAYMYAQRTRDGRIALGGRGRPYRFALAHRRARPHPRGDRRRADRPAARAVPGGGRRADRARLVWRARRPRDWCTTVTYDRATGTGAAGGYVGSGLAATNLAGRTLADLVLGVDSELTRLPWVGRRVRNWEPEPIRWLGVRAMYAMYRRADRNEYRSGDTGHEPHRPRGECHFRPLIDTLSA